MVNAIHTFYTILVCSDDTLYRWELDHFYNISSTLTYITVLTKSLKYDHKLVEKSNN